ncbi:MAG: hypothetical protein IPK97_04455 [Ahniella sp.]|nr:hypothetical protein [Ahniella sp.]
MNFHDPQTWVVLALVLASAVYALVQLAPNQVKRGERAMVLWLLKPARAPRLQALGRKLAPRHRAGVGAAGCGGCASSCESDGPAQT